MRRGFALLLVVLVGALVVILAGVMIERHGASRLNVARELSTYQAHHAGRGLTEVIAAWVQAVPNDDVGMMLSDDGHAFDLKTDDDTTIRVTLRDGQGSIMINGEALSNRDRDTVAEMMLHLRDITGGVVPESFVRDVGPVKVCAATAAPEVIEAAVRQAADDENVDQYVSEILTLRQQDDFRELHITQAATKAGFSPQATSRVKRVLTAEPTLWIVRAEITPRGAREPTDAYEGVAVIDNRGGPGGGSGLEPWGPFLSWERVEVEPVGLGDGDRP